MSRSAASTTSSTRTASESIAATATAGCPSGVEVRLRADQPFLRLERANGACLAAAERGDLPADHSDHALRRDGRDRSEYWASARKDSARDPQPDRDAQHPDRQDRAAPDQRMDSREPAAGLDRRSVARSPGGDRRAAAERLPLRGACSRKLGGNGRVNRRPETRVQAPAAPVRARPKTSNAPAYRGRPPEARQQVAAPSAQPNPNKLEKPQKGRGPEKSEKPGKGKGKSKGKDKP